MSENDSPRSSFILATSSSAIVAVLGKQLLSYTDAVETASFLVREPSAVPAGLTLRELRYFEPDFDGYKESNESFDWIEASYVDDNSNRYLFIWQGQFRSMMPRPMSKDAIQENANTGIATIQGMPAEWVQGQWAASGPAQKSDVSKGLSVRWVPNRTRIGWEHEELRYCLEGQGLSLEELVEVGNGLK